MKIDKTILRILDRAKEHDGKPCSSRTLLNRKEKNNQL